MTILRMLKTIKVDTYHGPFIWKSREDKRVLATLYPPDGVQMQEEQIMELCPEGYVSSACIKSVLWPELRMGNM